MKKRWLWLLLSSVCVLSGCDGSFVGPPHGSALATPGATPLIGATPFTFGPEMELETGFVVDHWFLDPGFDTNNFVNNDPFRLGDGIDALQNAGFEAFADPTQTNATPGGIEINVQFPITMSFICQWFGRLPNNGRPVSFDIFGRQVYSSAALDISLITAPVNNAVPPTQQGGPTTSMTDRGTFPNVNAGLPLAGWTSPPQGDPNEFPPSVQVFGGKQFSETAIIIVRSIAGGGSGGQGVGAVSAALGGALADGADNEHVETMASTVTVDQQSNTVAPASVLVGVFGDVYAERYKNEAVKQAPAPPQLINDPELEEALIEYSRHLGAVHANIIGQAIGLPPGNPGSLMDPAMAIFQNRYQYRFAVTDVDQMANVSLPGKNR